MNRNFDRNKTLEELENSFSQQREFVSGLIRRCHEARKIPVGKLSAEELRLLIGQQIGLDFLVELALEKLEENILTEGDYYPGDLLQNMLRIDRSYWLKNPEQRDVLEKLIRENEDILKSQKLDFTVFYSSDK